jgi:hypothetical protein
VPKRPIAAEQHGALLTIDTACHGLVLGVNGAIDCFAGGGDLISLFHMNRFSNFLRGATAFIRDRPLDGARIAQPPRLRETHGD